MTRTPDHSCHMLVCTGVCTEQAECCLLLVHPPSSLLRERGCTNRQAATIEPVQNSNRELGKCTNCVKEQFTDKRFRRWGPSIQPGDNCICRDDGLAIISGGRQCWRGHGYSNYPDNIKQEHPMPQRREAIPDLDDHLRTMYAEALLDQLATELAGEQHTHIPPGTMVI